jgi:hypothetical protein
MFFLLHCSGHDYDDTLLAKFESVYTDSGDHSSTMVGTNASSLPNLAIFVAIVAYLLLSLFLVVCFQH